MKKHYFKTINPNFYHFQFVIVLFLISIQINAQTVTAPQVNFTQRTSAATPAKTIYNIKGDFTMLGNTNLTLANSGTDNQGAAMKYVDIDGDANTWNSSKASLEVTNYGENGANPNCSTIIFAGLYWTGKSADADIFTASKQVQNGTVPVNNDSNVSHAQKITNTNYTLTINEVNGGGGNSNRYPTYTFSGNGNTYVFSYNNNGTVTLSVNGGMATNIPVTITTGTTNTATLTTPYTISDGTVTLTIKKLSRNPATANGTDFQNATLNYASVNVSGNVPTYTTATRSYNKKVVSLKGPGATNYSTITAKSIGTNSTVLFPGAAHSGIFVGYQEVTDYVKAHGPGAYTVADVALTEGTNSVPGFSGGWVMVVIYENPLLKSRAVTLFDGYAYVNGQLANGGEFGNIPISGFTTVGSGPVNMKLGVMAAEGDLGLSGDYLAVQKLNNDPTTYNATNYLTLNHAGNTTNNFFNSSIFPIAAAGTSDPILANNTGVDFSMFTIPNAGNSIIGNNQTSTTFRFGSTSDIFTIFGFAMSVDAYIPDPKGLIKVTSINNIPNPPVLNATPGQSINFSLNITNEGTEATNNTIVSIPIPATAIFNTGAVITYNTYNGFTTTNVPYYDSASNRILWNLGTLPITAGHPEYIYADLSFTLNVTTDCNIILSAGCSPEVSLQAGNISGIGATSGSSFTNYFFQGYDSSPCHLPIDGSIKVAIDASSCLSSMAGPDQMASCGGEYITLAASSGKTGVWSIVSGPSGGGEIFSNSSSPISTFYSPNLGVYTLRWTTSCSTTDDVIVTFSLCNVINFDGIDDHINYKNNFNLNSGNFSIETWIKPNASSNNIQSILSKHSTPTSSNGYDLRLVNNFVSFNWNNNAITASHAINTNRWYHIGVTFDGTNYKLYIDGILEKTAPGSNPAVNNDDCILGAMAQNAITPNNLYNGYADELRIWNVALTVDQVRKMMNQEIVNDGSGNVKGAIIPKKISGLAWSNLSGYFQMNRASDISNGYAVDKSGNGKNGKLKGIYVQEPDTAPLPYTTGANGNWETDATWTHYPVWDVPNCVAIDGSTKIDWNIVQTSHTVTSNFNKTVLGLLVTSNTLSAVNDSKLEVSSYLKLDGKIDLVGKSQLLQTEDSDLDVASAGSLERDQAGQSNKFNYNYWSSPVSPVNTLANNTDYIVSTIMKDGTSTTPQNIKWIGGYDGAATTPISVARYWLFKFDNSANAYANWAQVGETGALRVGQGYTMKGSGAATGTQNYTFTGKPNNGTVATNTVGADQLLLAGNPYPSALDADAFIADNLGSTDGTLYFWEHYATNNTHILKNYQGGYAERNLTGGVPATSAGVDFISGLGSTSRGIPNRFIPVGQSFFVYGNSTSGGPIVYKNTQRGFHKENEVGVSNVMFKTAATVIKENTIDNNNNDPVKNDNYKRIRLGYNSNNNYHRQVLLGFMEGKATSGIDYGYDGYNFDNFPNDMYFLSDEEQLVIQGVGHFNKKDSYRIGVKAEKQGKVTFMLDGVENFGKNDRIFIYDSEMNTYNDITTGPYEVMISSGEHSDRFSLCFTEKSKKDKGDKAEDTEKLSSDKNNDIKVVHLKARNILEIQNKSVEDVLQKVTLYNMNGQSVANWDVKEQTQQSIQLPVRILSSGVYIARIQTSNGDYSEKIIVP